MKSFASDNYSGIHPEILQAIIQANEQHVGSYGNDSYTEKAISLFKKEFGAQAEVFFVYNGTGANVSALSALTKSYHSILAPELAHINVDESTAPEKFLGCKIIGIPAADGKLTPQAIEEKIIRINDQHHPQAKVISISQSTEYGTVYTVDEIKAIKALATQYGLYLHMDGARISNAAVALGKSFKEFTSDVGVDVISFGGTKNGLLAGEAVVFLQPNLAQEFKFIRKQSMQLHSKMRFISAQFVAQLENELWKKSATHANAMAKKLEKALLLFPEIKITQSVDANGVFALLPAHIIEKVQAEIFFYVWNDKTNECRFMCSFDTTEEDIETLAKAIKKALVSA
ncbi:MAG: low specificity L-threonine aldolase [Cyclobacteriaceae bacterium]|jgi:threonine aldolase|nr:low specificity L-threonine aldolase [Cytophagales bacterium]MCZ8327228.1 low specificity L-threonine aldolase [Cyclobacteriaceae bacterium]